MNSFQFEIRYLAYLGMSKKLNLGLTQETLIDLVRVKKGGELVKKLTDTTPAEIKELTKQTYTDFKSDYLVKSENILFGEHSVSEYIERLEYEVKVIKEMGFNEYMLIVQEFINRSKANGIGVGPGRGSGAGSVLARFLGITDVDPLIYGLLFERFLNPARISMPDFDIDFEDTLREKVIEHVKEVYGDSKVSHIATFMKMASKAAFKDVARVMNVPFERANAISDMIPDGANLETMLGSENCPDELKNIVQNDAQIQDVINFASRLEGNIRQIGVHACGMIISPEDVNFYTAVQFPLKTTATVNPLVTQLDGKNLEKIGLLKMDFLGLRNLSIIKNCIKIIAAQHKKEDKKLPGLLQVYLDTMGFYPPLDDEKTYVEVLQTANTSGVFQFEGDGIKNFLSQLKPTDVNDIIAMGALYRPGPMEFIPNYIRRKHGEEEVNYMQPELAEILIQKYGEDVMLAEKQKLIEDLSPFCNLTYGIVVYQEQLMFMVQSMAGFSLAEADNLRRGVGKKIIEVIEKIKGEFIEKAAEFRQYKPETTKRVYEKMVEPAAFYSFNKSHAVAYGLISYQTAYLKANYPVQFYAALLRSVEEDTDKLSKFIDEVQFHGMKLLPTNINESFNHVSAISDGIRLGFFTLKGVGSDVGESIENEREKNGKFKNMEDFMKRCSTLISKKSLESLAKAGAFDEFMNRATILNQLELILERGKHSQKSGGGLFGESFESKMSLKPFEQSRMSDLLGEYDVVKGFISGHPFDGLYNYLKKFNFFSQLKASQEFGKFNCFAFVKNVQRAKKKGFFITFEDVSENIEIFFRETYGLQKFDVVMLSGTKLRSVRLNKLVKINIEDYIKNAKNSGKYDETLTILSVRANRLKNITNNSPVNKPELETNKVLEELVVEKKMKFDLPSDLRVLKNLAEIIKQHPGDIEIELGSKKVKVSEEGYGEIIQNFEL